MTVRRLIAALALVLVFLSVTACELPDAPSHCENKPAQCDR